MVPDELQPLLPEWLILGFAVLGFLVFAIRTLRFLVSLIPSFKRRTYDKAANWIKHKKLVKKAEAARIEETLNQTITQLQDEFPVGWIKKVSLKFVMKLDPDDIAEGEVITSIQISESQDENLLTAIFHSLRNSLFPNLKDVIPDTGRESIAIQLCRRIVEEMHTYLEDHFNESFLEQRIRENQEILDLLEKLEKVDKKGLLTGVFLRELNEIASKARHKPLRNQMSEELGALLNHVNTFVKNARKKTDEELANDEMWYRVGPETSYAILLVANAQKARSSKKRLFINRAQQWKDKKIQRLYVFGANPQKRFTERIIGSISSISGFELIEVYKTNRDFRGEKGGVGAVFKISQ